MNAPILTLHAPYKIGKDWVLCADIHIGDDTVTLKAKLTPRTLRWAKKQFVRSRDWTERKARKARKWIRFTGDWKKFGPLARVAFNTAKDVAGHPLLQNSSHVKDGAKLFSALEGKKGPQAQQLANVQCQRILDAAKKGDFHAIEAWNILQALSRARDIFNHPNCYYLLSQLCYNVWMGDNSARFVLDAVKALGSCCCNGQKVQICYDIENLMMSPNKASNFVNWVNDVQMFKGANQGWHPSQVKRLLDEVYPFSVSTMPYYGAGSNPDEEQHGAREGYGGYFEDIDYELGEWGYRQTPRFIPPSIQPSFIPPSIQPQPFIPPSI